MDNPTEREIHKTIVLKMMLIGSLCLTSILNLIISLELIINRNGYSGIEPILPAWGHLVVASLLYICLKGHIKLASFGYIFSLIFPSAYCSIRWGSLMHQALLLYVLVIVVTSVLFNTISAIYITGAIFIFLLILTHAQQMGYLTWDSDWVNNSFDNLDVITSFSIFCVITLIQWISNSELAAALSKSYAFEEKLKMQNDNLEATVVARTRELLLIQELRVKELNRFANFGKLTGNLIHDLITPLTTVSLNLEILSNYSIKNTQFRETVDRSITATNKALYYIKDSYKFLGNEKQVLNFNPNEEIAGLSLLLEHKLKNISFTTDLCFQCTLCGNPIRFSQLISNLINNAIDAVESRGKEQMGRIALTTNIYNNKYKVEITDSGIGIDSKSLKRIWDPFFTTKVVGKGSGLGLYICKEIINEFNGTIEIESQENEGTKATILLPLKLSNPPTQPSPKAF